MTDDDKRAWRDRIRAARRGLDDGYRADASDALSHAVGTLASRVRERGDGALAAYVPIGREPGSTAMLDAAMRTGVAVLLPIAGDSGPMSWARYTGPNSLVLARHGLLEPSGPILPPAAIGDAAVILVPALAVDRRGGRLGRGAGFYDRTLHLAASDAWLVGVVYDDDLVDRLPTEDHDVRMTHVLTPGGGLRPLPLE
ncbi:MULTISPECIES: 5-formyltetrahydrofolate cyclo-ligase [Nocardiaceae]|uniref:5-formyltetrahydrofolate cyclo-ligase n=1 Tax=Rhodococcoides kroppenstedtii TaxID=293050 RepID=A0ABS7NWT4_9NOCA|nr:MULTISPECIES: 5-formyltetrahydrofolate cyclo-ligase [Rhodococcus]AMY19949.1 5-formyltetrahydrofolate cyclo-ligase [Rhodococcus sp. PBTS 1]MBY6314697.1 5-formyltetrahydrofolate cyclo-ligase [Rhodococcus kroppenstedtii]MBY6322504.1 5-formyltetrahydrofolate cyclo-ligase [Rhodococcus kroppenstedtii]MBY6401308.1 5-formyltetrahydrofolate cyclo-ligase [Rhodococcus kroppenstedtii]